MKKKSTKARNRQKWNFSYAQWGRYRKARALKREHDKQIKDAQAKKEGWPPLDWYGYP